MVVTIVQTPSRAFADLEDTFEQQPKAELCTQPDVVQLPHHHPGRFAALDAESSSDQLSELSTPSSPQPLSAQRLRDKYNRLYAMADSAPEGPLSDVSNGAATPLQQPAGSLNTGGNVTADAAQGNGYSRANSQRADVHLSLTEMLLLQEDSVGESRATPLLSHRLSMASVRGDGSHASFSALSPHSANSEPGSFQLSPSQLYTAAESASSQQVGTSDSDQGWPGPAPEWISIVVRGKHKDRETFAQYHVPEGLVYVNGIKLSPKVYTWLYKR